MAPGRTVTNAAAIAVETLKLVLSAIWIVPVSEALKGRSDCSGKMKGCGGTGASFWMAARSAARSPGTVPWKIQRLCRGIFAKLCAGTPKFLASTSGGVCGHQWGNRQVLHFLAWSL